MAKAAEAYAGVGPACFFLCFQPSETRVVTIDLGRTAPYDRIHYIGPKFQRGPLLSIVLIAIVNAVGDATLALPAMVLILSRTDILD
jgi:hypothetical protein